MENELQRAWYECRMVVIARSRAQRAAEWMLQTGARMPRLVRLARHPLAVAAGYRIATAVGITWGAALSVGALEERGGVFVARGCPRWAFGRGGTTIGAVYLTSDNDSSAVLEHEAVHRAQWQRYGLAFVLLYLAAGPVARGNRFEVEAGLAKGGYR